MPVFVVVVTKGAEAAKRRIATLPENSWYEVKDDTWLIDYPGTSQSLAESLQVRPLGADATGIVFSISNYSGRHKKDIWEWLQLHMTRET